MPVRRIRHRDDAAPAGRERQPGEQRRHAVAVRPPSALEHEAAAGERPRADRRTARAADGAAPAPPVSIAIAVELGQCTRDRQRELRARSEAGVRRQRRCTHSRAPGARRCAATRSSARNRRANSAARPVSSPATSSVAAGGPRRAASARAPPRRCRRTSVPACRARSSRPKCSRAGVSTKTAAVSRRVRHAPSGLARTWSVRSAIASSSCVPAVLSTITCSRCQFALDERARQQVQARRVDRRFEHGMARAIEADELAAHAVVHHDRLDAATAAACCRSIESRVRATSSSRPAPRRARPRPAPSGSAGSRSPPARTRAHRR